MLKPVERPGEHRPPRVPDDLLVVNEADAQQAIEHLAREFARVPDEGRFETRNERERVTPVGSAVTV
jgi:hypothetical protein